MSIMERNLSLWVGDKASQGMWWGSRRSGEGQGHTQAWLHPCVPLTSCSHWWPWECGGYCLTAASRGSCKLTFGQLSVESSRQGDAGKYSPQCNQGHRWSFRLWSRKDRNTLTSRIHRASHFWSFQKAYVGTCLAIQWLRLCLPMQGFGGSTPGQGTKIPYASQPKKQNIKQKQYCNKFKKDFKNGPHFKKKRQGVQSQVLL